MIDIKSIRRGEIYLTDLGEEKNIGSEQRGFRPTVIIQNDIGNYHSPVTIVAVITSKDKPSLPTHFRIKSCDPNSHEQWNTVALEQVRTVDKTRLVKKVGELRDEEIDQLNRCIRVSMGLPIETKNREEKPTSIV